MKKEKLFSEIAQRSTQELRDSLSEKRKLLMRVRFSKKAGESKGYESKTIKREIARIKTVLSSKCKGEV